MKQLEMDFPEPPDRDVLYMEYFLLRVMRVWAEFPTLRFSQLIQILLSEHRDGADGFDPKNFDIFYLEDKKFLELFTNFARERSVTWKE